MIFYMYMHMYKHRQDQGKEHLSPQKVLDAPSPAFQRKLPSCHVDPFAGSRTSEKYNPVVCNVCVCFLVCWTSIYMRPIHVIVCVWGSFLSLLCSIFHCVNTPQFAQPVSRGWTSGLFLIGGYCEQSCCERPWVCLCVNISTHFSQGCGWEWDYRVIV